MDDKQSLSHTKWECKYHLVWIPKYRKKELYTELRRYLGPWFRDLAFQKESQILEGHLKPDHVHMLLYPDPARSLTQVMKGIKGVTARKLNEKRGTRGHVWQDEYYDRIIRDNDEFVEKLQYMFHNPLKYELAEDPLKYDGWYIKEAADRNVCPTNPKGTE